MIENKEIKNKKAFMAFIFIALCISQISAQSNTGALSGANLSVIKSLFQAVYAFLSSTYVLVIASAALVGIGLGMYMNRGTPVVKSLLPWLIATIIVGVAPGLTKLIFNPQFEVSGLTSGTPDIFKEIF